LIDLQSFYVAWLNAINGLGTGLFDRQDVGVVVDVKGTCTDAFHDLEENQYIKQRYE
jgi:hypothetical protein